MKRALTYSIVLVVVLLTTIELVIRVVSWLTGNGFFLALHELDPYNESIETIYRWHPFTGYTFRPAIEILGSHPALATQALVYTDRHGFLVPTKGENIPERKLPGEIRIATIGASTTANIALEWNENWPGYLGRLVQAAFSDRRVRVINAGVPGYDTAQSIGNLALRVMPLQPDVVIVYHAYNDLKAVRPRMELEADYSHIHTRPYGYHDRPNALIRLLGNSMFYVRARNKYREYRLRSERARSLAKEVADGSRLSRVPDRALDIFEQHVRSLVSIARGGGAGVVLSSFATLHDIAADWSDERTIEGLSEPQRGELRRISHFTVGLTVPGVFDGLRRYNKLLERLARREATGWVDNAALIPHDDAYFVDRVHFSPLGAERMAKDFFPAVMEVLAGQGQAP
jgi:lysophospholipase L1-like esterase